MLSVLLTVGLMTYLTSDALPSSSTSLTLPTNPPFGTTTTSNVLGAAHKVACIADTQAIDTAIALSNASGVTVGAETGITIGNAASYPQGIQARSLVHQHLLRQWPSDTQGYAIALSTTQPGQIEVFVPPTSRTPQNSGAQPPWLGCRALASG